MFKIPFNKPPCFRDSFTEAIKEATDAGKFSGDGINSKKCVAFFKSKFQYEHSLLTPSCTAALEMAALLLGLGPGDEVIVPSFTFVTTANAFALRGVDLIFADSEKRSPNVSVADILSKVTPRTKAIVVVHYAGVPVDVHAILNATQNRIPVVEDCAHAIGSVEKVTGDFVGKAGCLSTFSFHETKNIGIGEGGLLVVNDEKLWRQAQIVREKGTNRVDFQQGRAAFYTWISLGSSYLMSDIDAALLWSSLQHYEEIQKARVGVWNAYDQHILKNSAFKKPGSGLCANAHMYFLKFNNFDLRQKFCKAMKNAGILVATHYLPLDTSPFIKDLDSKADGEPTRGVCAQSAAWSEVLVRLPLFYDLSQAQITEIVDEINTFSSVHGYVMDAATADHWEQIRQLRNSNNQCFQQTKEISVDEHTRFMGKHHLNYRVVLEKGKCIGFIGHVRNDVRLATSAKGKGVAQFMWAAFTEEYDNLEVKVKVNNERSIGFFRKLGYHPDEKALVDGIDPVPLLKAPNSLFSQDTIAPQEHSET